MLKYTYQLIICFLFSTTVASAQPHSTVSYETKLETADLAAQSHDYAGAIEWFKKALDESKDKSIRVVIGDLYMLLRDYKRAQKSYERALRRDDEGAFEYVRIDLAKALKYQGNYRDALVELRTVASTTEDDSTRQVAQFEIEGIESMDKFPQNIETVVGYGGTEINSGSGENSPAQLPDGTLYYSSFKRNKVIDLTGDDNDYYAKIYSTKVNNQGKFDKPTDAGDKINRPGYNSAGVSFSADGRTMYFTRTELDVNAIESSKIYRSTRSDEGWNGPEPIDILNSDDWLSLYPVEGELFGERVLYFTSDMDGGYGGKDIYYSKITGDTYGTPINLGSQINSPKDDITPYYKDGVLYFSTDGKPGFGGFDIYKSTWNGEQWSTPENLGHKFNSPQDDMYFRYNVKGNGGYIVSNRPSKAKRRLKGSDTCCDDIYVFSEKEILIDLLVTITDENGNPLNEATVELITTDDDTEPENKTSVNSNEFNFSLNPNSSYNIKVSRNEYKPDSSVTFNTIGLIDDYTVKKTIKLIAKPKTDKNRDEDGDETIVVDAREPIRLNNIYYDFDKSSIKEKSEDNLQYLKSLMEQYPDMVIELSSHTDSRGPGRYNKKLSQKRAQSAAKWLTRRGIENSRIKAVGYGESQLLNRCKNGVKCSEEEHQLNRRTEFKVLSGPTYITIKKKVTGGHTPSSGDRANTQSGKQNFDNVPVITFDKAVQNLGKLVKGESVDLTYTFTNTGNTDLVIELATTCKCTDIAWPKTPVKPNEKGVITATYHTKNQHIGKVEKTINIIANTDPIVVEAKFNAEILPATDATKETSN